METKVLLYVKDEDREKEIIDLFNENKIENVNSIKDVDLNTYVGEIFGLDVKKNTENMYENVDGEFMMLANFPNDDVLNILKIFRENNVKRPITCTLTENNTHWKLGELFSDLKLEDEYMKKMNQKN